jgi:HK97 family phage prohead protease
MVRIMTEITIEKRNYDNTNLSVEEIEEEKRLVGYGAVIEKRTVICNIDGLDYYEIIDRNAFKNTDFSQCCLKYNHSNSYPIVARVKNNSLSLSIDNIGLKYEARLLNTSSANDLYISVQEGLLDKSSFSFTVKRFNYDKQSRTRRILEIDKVFDVSVVDIPAYNDTSVQARNFFEEMKEKEVLKREQFRKKLICQSYL